MPSGTNIRLYKRATFGDVGIHLGVVNCMHGRETRRRQCAGQFSLDGEAFGGLGQAAAYAMGSARLARFRHV